MVRSQGFWESLKFGRSNSRCLRPFFSQNIILDPPLCKSTPATRLAFFWKLMGPRRFLTEVSETDYTIPPSGSDLAAERNRLSSVSRVSAFLPPDLRA